LGADDAHPGHAARRAWAALWPSDARRRHALFALGLESLLRLDTEETRTFFNAFFNLPAGRWEGYLNDRLPAAELATTMARLFARTPARLRWQLAAPALSGDGIRLATSWLRSLAQ
jgi:lycopene beta-cyclase